MNFFKNLSEKPKFLFKAKEPKLSDYIGRSVVIPIFATLEGKKTKIDEKKVVIETISGNKFKPHFYEINGSSDLIGMLRFHAQMLNDKSITEDQFSDFEAIEYEVVKQTPESTEKKVKKNV